jgi:CDP-diacylglycerol--glycerol-3-phosphate 3-phosphatidyltransferase
MVWNLPNTLTALRIGLIPVFISLVYLPRPWGFILSTAFFGVAALTDWADGYIARRQGTLTRFGRFFDPVADKLLVISALLLLVSEDRAPLVLVLIITAREITIMALREFMSGRGGRIPVSNIGKWKTGFQMSAIVMLLLQDGLLGIPFQVPGLLCLYAAVLLTVWSAYDYLTHAWPQISDLE